MQQVLVGTDIQNLIEDSVDFEKYDKIFVLTDSNTNRLCLPRLLSCENLPQNAVEVIQIEAGDEHKNISSLQQIWMNLSSKGATRHSVLVNLGGGMISDIGGFAAATFKRGIESINIPTTLLGTIDAAVGGKTGINFMGLKNEIGAFNPAKCVLVDTTFFQTLDFENIKSGYAEMIKHGLISNQKEYRNLMNFDLGHQDKERMTQLLGTSIDIKQSFVEKDPKEQNIRKALNFGHTIGHALESLSHEEQRPILHGHAVAMGIIGELYLSTKKEKFPMQKLHEVEQYIKKYYAPFEITCDHYERLYALMTHDKKNIGTNIRFTFLEDIGELKIDCITEKREIFDALDYYRDVTGQ